LWGFLDIHNPGHPSCILEKISSDEDNMIML
jgi:hypothetical protein